MKNTLQHIILSLVAALLFMACSSGTTSTSETDVIPTAATFSAAIDGDVYVTLPISQLGLAEADLSGASMVVYRNEVLWDYDLDASVLYNTDNLSLYFVLVQMEAGDDIRVELETSDGRTATYTGSISDTEDFTADVSSTDMPVTAGTDTTDTGDAADDGTETEETGDAAEDEIDPLYLLTVGQIDANGEAIVSFNFNIIDTTVDDDDLVLVQNETIDPEETYSLIYDEILPYIDDNAIVSLVFHNVSDKDRLFMNIYTIDGNLYVAAPYFSATETQEFDMTPNWLSSQYLVHQNK
jgi:hypothetical protein